MLNTLSLRDLVNDSVTSFKVGMQNVSITVRQVFQSSRSVALQSFAIAVTPFVNLWKVSLHAFSIG